jgi:hypothetical protein
MAPNWERHKQQDQDQADDDLGSLIRWSLEDSLRRETPPDDLWPKIRSRIEARTQIGETAPLGRKRLALSLAPLIQTVVASSLVLTFALGVDRSGGSLPEAQVNRPTVPRTVVLGSARPQDIPKIHIASRPLAKQVVHQRIGGVAE